MKKNLLFKLLAVLIVLITSATQMRAAVTGGEIYFDVSTSGWGTPSTVEYIISHDSYSCWYRMTSISNTKLYHITSSSWGDAKYIAFTGNYGWTSCEGNSYDSRKGYGPSGSKRTAKNTYGVNSGSYYLFYASSSANDAAITTSSPAGYLGSGKTYTALNYTQTLNQTLSTDGGSTYSASTIALATVGVSSYELNGKTSTTSSSGTISSGSSSTSCSAARTATVTYTVSSVTTGYEFVGWYDGSTQKSTSTTYTYTSTAAKTITARFKKKQYTVSYGVYASSRWGSIKLNSGSAVTTTSSSTLNHGTAIAFTATPNSGYQVEGWYSDAACSAGNRLQSGGTSYNAGTLTAAKTVYVKFAVRTGGTVTLNAGSNGQVSLDNSSWGSSKTKSNITTNTAFNIYAQGNTGYQFSSWTKNSGSGTIGSTSTANTTFTPVAYEDATVTASFSEIMRTVTISGGSAASTTAGVATQGTATANAPAEGKKFTGWTLGTGVSLAGGYALTDRTIKFTATQNSSVTANYADRAGVKMYFAKPTNASWSKVYAYAWQNGGSAKNANYPGIELSTTETINCIVYYIYQYYTEADGIGGAATGNSAWDRIIFGDNNNDRKTGDLTISNGHYYYWNSSTTGSATAKTTAWYIKGTMNSWGESDPVIIDCDTHSGSANIALTGGTQYEFKVYDDVSTKMMSNSTACGNITSSTSAETLYTADANSMRITPPVTGTYTFTVGSVNTTTPTIAVTFPTALSIYRSNPNDATNVGDHPWDTHVGNEFTWALDLEANTTYEFKINQEGSYYGYDANDITTSISATTFSTGTNDTKLITKSAGTFNFTWNSSTHKLSIQYPKSVVVTASPVSVYTGGTTTLTGTASELGSGSHTITYEFFKGTTLTDANKIATKNKTASGASQSVTQDVTVDFAGNDMSQVYTIRIKESSNVLATNVVTVYRKWDIYVNDVCSWGAMKLYNWDASGSYPVAFPGTAQPLVDGSTHWYKVTLDARYPNFKLSKQSGTESNNHTASISSYGAGTYWYLNNCQTLTSVSITTPTVTLSATVTNATQINLTGNITNFGGDGSKASEMKEVYFKVNNVKDAASITASTTNGEFTKSLSNPTPDATNNTLQAFATNIGYTGSSSAVRFTRVSLDKQSGTGGTATILAVNGSAMASDVTAPTRDGYVFGGYFSEEDGAGTKYYDSRMNSAHNWDQTTATKTLYAKWTARTTFDVYFYNKDNWSPVKAYLWNGPDNRWEKAWPGTDMTEYQSKIFKHSYESAEDYDHIQFNDGTDAHKTNQTLPAMNQMFYNPGANEWSQYIMVADFPTTKQVAVVGEKITIEPVISWADVIEFDDITITATKTSGSPNITVMAAGTKIIATATAAGEATYTVTYTYSTTTITKTLEVQFTQGVVIQSKVPKTDPYWKNSQDVEGIHYWGTNLTSGDVKMTWLKADENYDYYQALVPLGTDNKTNFLFYYDNYTTDAWRKTLDVTNVTEDGCYIIGLTNSNKDVIRTATKDGTGLCNDSYQLVITMGSGDIYTSNIVTSNSEIVSFFAPSNANESKTYRQGTVTLEHNGLTVYTYPANTFSASGVYTAKINANYSLNSLALYTGDYYIRTDQSDGGWDHYKDAGMHNKMTQFTRNANFANETFSYYWVNNVAKGSGDPVNIKATVANDINPVLCNFSADDNIAQETHGVNLRFGYEPTTNDLVRGILRGSNENNFLNLIGFTANIYKEVGCTTLLNEDAYSEHPEYSKLQDKSNWVYEAIVYAKIDDTHDVADVYLKSYYNGIHYLLGMEKDSYGRETNIPITFEVIKTGTTHNTYGLRVIYDFKTNRLFAAWAPADIIISGDVNVDADVMFLRHEDGDVAQIDFANTSSSVTNLKKAIFALEIDDDRSQPLGNRELHYFITLPFDCNVKDIFGIGGYMTYWGVQRYRGDLRAQKGWFKETDTFWEWLGTNETMKAGEGYLVSIDKKELQKDDQWKTINYQVQVVVTDGSGNPIQSVVNPEQDSVRWEDRVGSILTLYFPSTTTGFDIEPANDKDMTITYKNEPCTITREDRDKQDSNWKCMGTPGYKNITLQNYVDADPDHHENTHNPPYFLYVFSETYEAGDGKQYKKGTYTATESRGYTFHSFMSYMVQFAGTITWNRYSKETPATVAPRRMPSEEHQATKAEINLLSADNKLLDRTFVWLQEGATIGFDQNYDLNKMTQKNANQIYSYAENNVSFAANVLPLETDTVQLVVNIANEGEFTFSLNNDKHVGMAPVLYDMFKSEKVNLMTTDYVVELETGKYDDRFFLLFQPVQPIVTNFETTEDGGQKVHSGEAIYDVLGRRVNTIYPGHLYIVNGEKRIAK